MLSLTNQIPAESRLIRLPMDPPAFMGILAFFTAVALLCLAFLLYLYASSRKQRRSQHAFDHTVDSEWALWSSSWSLRAAQNQPAEHRTMQAKCPSSGNATKVKYVGHVPLRDWFMPKHLLGSTPTILGTLLLQRPYHPLADLLGNWGEISHQCQALYSKCPRGTSSWEYDILMLKSWPPQGSVCIFSSSETQYASWQVWKLAGAH